MNLFRKASVLSLGLLPFVTGCSWTASASPTVPARGGVQASNPFGPVSVRIHPLTRTVNAKDAAGAGPVEVVVHLEMRDAWGDSTKGVGAVLVRLVRQRQAGVGADPGSAPPGDQSQRWDIDLSDLGTNAAMFDPATRTYRMQLTGAPAWVAGGVSTDGSRGRTMIQATLTMPGGTILTAESLLER